MVRRENLGVFWTCLGSAWGRGACQTLVLAVRPSVRHHNNTGDVKHDGVARAPK